MGRKSRQTIKKDQIAERNREIWRLRQLGLSEVAIAQQMGLSGAGIHGILKRIRLELAEQFETEQREWRADQFATLEAIKQDCLAQWRHSMDPAETETVVTGNAAINRYGDVVELPDVTTRVRAGQSGNPTMLTTAMKAMSDQRRIYGLDAVEKKEIELHDSGAADSLRKKLDDLAKRAAPPPSETAEAEGEAGDDMTPRQELAAALETKRQARIDLKQVIPASVRAETTEVGQDA